MTWYFMIEVRVAISYHFLQLDFSISEQKDRPSRLLINPIVLNVMCMTVKSAGFTES